MINTTMTVRDVVVEFPEATRVFERLKIDYCCGGNRRLADACSVTGLAVETVIEMVKAAGAKNEATVDFQKLGLPKLIAHILDTHHVFTREEMARLDALLQKVIGAHGENHPELNRLSALFATLSDDLKPHMLKEEQILFPYIISLAEAQERGRRAPFAPFVTVNNPVRMMMREHDTAGELLRELRTVTSNYTTPGDACISYRTLYEAMEGFERDLHQHIHLENNILFPRAIELEQIVCNNQANQSLPGSITERNQVSLS
ncbi:MAG TPA: iron-sulfur cluster repair di-iron protein [Pyrinomonadaceae bacterium]|nr:iron-sulfur cluster repair di-iron protein [Pyrinomonadaceae bacterium]